MLVLGCNTQVQHHLLPVTHARLEPTAQQLGPRPKMLVFHARQENIQMFWQRMKVRCALIARLVYFQKVVKLNVKIVKLVNTKLKLVALLVYCVVLVFMLVMVSFSSVYITDMFQFF